MVGTSQQRRIDGEDSRRTQVKYGTIQMFPLKRMTEKIPDRTAKEETRPWTDTRYWFDLQEVSLKKGRDGAREMLNDPSEAAQSARAEYPQVTEKLRIASSPGEPFEHFEAWWNDLEPARREKEMELLIATNAPSDPKMVAKIAGLIRAKLGKDRPPSN